MKTCVITGATSGLGRALALELARHGFSLVLTGRNQRSGEATLGAVTSIEPAGNHRFLSADLSDLEQVRQLGAEILECTDGVDCLINNAGVRMDSYVQGGQGYEQTFATNHLGHFLLSALLWPALENSLRPVIVSVTSGVRSSARVENGWIQSADGFDRRRAYANSKLANLLFAAELARCGDGIGLASVAVDPGILATRFARNNGVIPWLKHCVSHGVRGELGSTRTMARRVVDAICPCAKAVNGTLVSEDGVTELVLTESQDKLARELWAASLHWTGLGTASIAGPFGVSRPRESEKKPAPSAQL